jgi:hypothetical protein
MILMLGTGQPAEAAVNTDEFVSEICPLIGGPQGNSTWLLGIERDDDLFGCYSALDFAVPNKNFDGKQWYVNREAGISTEDIIKSFVIYSRVKLLPERKVENNVYVETLACRGIKPDQRLLKKESNINRSDVKKLFTFLLENKARLSESDPDCIPGVLELEDGKQAYFPDGPLHNELTVGVEVPENSEFHQYSSIYGVSVNNSKKVNTVGVWGDAVSNTEDGKVWGGFFTANSGIPGNETQLVGVEIDVINKGKPGVYPYNSKVGLQVVTIGDEDSSIAIEVLSDHKSKWKNGLLIGDEAIAPDGAGIAIANKKPIQFGIDASQGSYSDSAILLPKDSRVTFRGSNFRDAFIYGDTFDTGYLVMGGSGIRMVNADNTRNILKVSNHGIVSSDSLIYQRYFLPYVSVLALALVLSALNVFLYLRLRKERNS